MNKAKFTIYTVLVMITALNLWYFADTFWPTKRTESLAATKTVSFEDSADVVVYKNAGCRCCTKWADYLRNNQLTVNEQEITNLPALRQEKGIPANMRSCHTAVVEDYVIEGHVPVEDIRKLIDQQPDAVGLAAPGMPKSAPGMNTAPNEPYTVYLIKQDGSSQVFAEH